MPAGVNHEGGLRLGARGHQGRAAAATVAASLALAPLTFGAVQPWAWAALLVALLLGATGGAAADLLARRQPIELPAAPIMLGIAIAGIVALLQLTPLPRATVRALSEATDLTLATRFPLYAAGLEWRPLTLDRGATIEALMKGAIALLAFVLAARAARDPERALSLLTLVVIAGVVQALYGLWARTADGGRIFGYEKPVFREVVTGTYVNRNHLAGLLGMAIPAALALAGRGPSSRRGHGRRAADVQDGDLPRARRVLLVGAAAVMSVALVGSLSRAGTAAAAAGAVACALVLALESDGRRRALRIVAAGAGAALLALASGSLPLIERFASLSGADGGSDASAAARRSFVEDTARMVADRPLLGVGAGAFEAAYPAYQSLDFGGRAVTHAHCDYLELAAELGLPSALALAACALATAALAWTGPRAREDAERRFVSRAALAALVPIALHSAVDFNLRIPANLLACAALLGVAWGAARPGSRLVVRPPASPAGRAALAGVLVAGLLAACAGPVAVAQADWAAQPFIERTRPDPRALDEQVGGLERAVALFPYRAETQALLGAALWDRALRLHAQASAAAVDGLIDPERTTSGARAQLAAALGQARRRRSPALSTGLREARARLDRAIDLAPADPRWSDLRSRLMRSAEGAS